MIELLFNHTNATRGTKMTKTLTLWSKRFSTAQGNHWKAEREVTEQNAQEWLAVFRKDEPKVLFLASAKKPKG